MSLSRLLGSLIGGTLSARQKKHNLASRFLTGDPGSFLNVSTIMSAAALGFGAYEIYRTRSGAGSTSNATIGGSSTVPIAPPISAMSTRPASAPFSLPQMFGGARSTVEVVPGVPTSATITTGAAIPTQTVPPLPASAVAASLDAAARAPISAAADSDGVRRIAELLVAAARADGELGEEEFGKMVALAAANGADREVQAALVDPRPIAVIVAGVRDPKLKEDLYVLAFTIVRADEDVTGAERIWLASLASALALDATTTARIEKETVQRIQRAL